MLVLKGFVGLHRTVRVQFLSITGWGIDLGYCDIEWFALETNRDHSVIFEIAPGTAFQTLLLTMMVTPFLLRDSLVSYFRCPLYSLLNLSFSAFIYEM